MPSPTGTRSGDQFIAGLLAGGTATTLLHPLDLLKTRLQVRTESLPQGLFNYARQLRKAAGWRGFYRGFTANLAGSTASWGLYLALYDRTKQLLSQDGDRSLKSHEFFLASAMASSLTVLICNPLWMAKTRLCLAEELPAQPGGLLACLRQTAQKEGMTGLYRGLAPGLLGITHGAVQFAVYEQLKLAFPHSNSSLSYLGMSATSKVMAACLTYPYQVVRSRCQRRGEQRGMLAVTRCTWQQEGWRGFYRGLVPSTLRVLPATCLTFVVFEQLNHFFKA